MGADRCRGDDGSRGHTGCGRAGGEAGRAGGWGGDRGTEGRVVRLQVLDQGSPSVVEVRADRECAQRLDHAREPLTQLGRPQGLEWGGRGLGKERPRPDGGLVARLLDVDDEKLFLLQVDEDVGEVDVADVEEGEGGELVRERWHERQRPWVLLVPDDVLSLDEDGALEHGVLVGAEGLLVHPRLGLDGVPFCEVGEPEEELLLRPLDGRREDTFVGEDDVRERPAT